jgi:transposase, IS30 family
LQRFEKGSDAMGFVHDVGTRDRFYELVCVEGASLTAAVDVVGAGVGSSTRWWRQAFGMDVVIAKGSRGGPARGASANPVSDVQPGRFLTLPERRVIEYGLARHHSLTEIASGLGRDKSVVSREVARNKTLDGRYLASVAHLKAWLARRRPKEFKLHDPALCERIDTWMSEHGWSPALIAATLRAEVEARGGGENERVSHETIYQALYVQGRGHLRADLHKQLSTQRPKRRSRGRAVGPGSGNPYSNAFTISDRPAEVADRAVPGHWEGDLIVGPYSRSAIGTLVERATRFTILLHLPGRHTAEEVAEAMIREMGQLPEHLRRSLTWDRGTEMTQYARIQTDLKMPVYFCDPHSPWQRGTNENTNRLLRHWFPKSTDLHEFSAADLRTAADSLNARPRPTLEMRTPAQALNQLLQQQAA